MIASIEFNEAWYLAQNPDVRAAVEAGGFHSALQHFEMYGKQEGRSPSPIFDPAFYLSENPDVAAAVERGETTAYDHFATFGTSEGRSPSPLFDPDFYLDHNPDVAAAVRRGETTAVEHFLNYGQNEGRPLTPAIDMGAYLDANPDVADAVARGQVNGLEHLLLHGIGEGRDLGNGVDLSWFDDDEVFQEALAHGDAWGAWARVESVAPFFESFTGPEGWALEEGAAPPADYTPPEGVGMVDAGDGSEGGAAGPDPEPEPEPEPEAPDPDEDPDDDPDDPGPDPAVFNTAHEVRVSTGSQQATIDFESFVSSNTADLKAAIRVRVDGESFVPLGAADSATISGGNLVITFAEPVRSNDLAFEIAPGALRDGSGAVNGRIETLALDNLPPAAPTVGLLADTGDSGTDGITNNGTVSVTPAEEGGHWEYSTDGGASWQAGGGTSFVLPAGEYEAGAIQVRHTDAAGNTSDPGMLAGAVTVITDGPATPDAVLANDTGDSATDSITSDAALTAPTNSVDATVEYRVRLDDGEFGGWSQTYTSPTVDGAYTVEVRQTDAAGNVSSIQTITFTLDRAAPLAPTLAFAEDTGRLADDDITSNGMVNVTPAETGGRWEYSTDGGISWQAGQDTSFALVEGQFAAGSVRARQVDAAGNVGEAAQLGAITIDMTAPEIQSMATSTDGGTITIQYNEAVFVPSGVQASAFTLEVDGEPLNVSEVSTNGKALMLTLAQPILFGQTAVLSIEAGAVEDAAGNLAPVTTSPFEVTNHAANTFTVTDVDGVWVFGGTAIGDIVMSVDESGYATFSRDNVDAPGPTPLSQDTQSRIQVDEGVNLKVSGAALHALDVMFVGEGSVDVTDLEPTQAGWTGSEAHGARVTDDIDIAKVLFASLLDDGAATLTVNDGISDYIKLGWIYLDQDYYSQSAEKGLEAAYYNTSLTVAKAELALLYVDYLEQGGSAFADFLGKAAGDEASPTRAQSIHDNLLGELGRAALQDRLSANNHTAQTPHEAYPALDESLSWSGLLDLYLDRAGEYADRPYVGGYSNKQADQVNGALWDMAHGIERSDFNTEGADVLVVHNHDNTVTAHQLGLDFGSLFSSEVHAGDTVYIAAGDYDAIPEVTVPSLTLLGAKVGVAASERLNDPTGETIIDGSKGILGIYTSDDDFTGKLTVDGFTVLTGTYGGIGQGMDASQGTVVFQNNILKAGDGSFGSHGNTIQISGQSSQVTDNYLETAVYKGGGSTEWSTSGITVVVDASGSIISGNTVLLSESSELDVTHSAYGIALDGHWGGVLTGITISDNTISGLTGGISLQDTLGGSGESQAINVSGNSLIENNYGIGLGTTTSGWNDVLYIDISDNTFSGSGFADIAFFEFEEGSVTIGVNHYSDGEAHVIWFSEGGAYGAEDRDAQLKIDISGFTSGTEGVFISSGDGFGNLTVVRGDDAWQISAAEASTFEHLEISLVGHSDWDASEIEALFAVTTLDAG